MTARSSTALDVAAVAYVLAVVAALVIWVGIINLPVSDLRREREPEMYDCHGGCGAVGATPADLKGWTLVAGEWVCPACIEAYLHHLKH